MSCRLQDEALKSGGARDQVLTKRVRLWEGASAQVALLTAVGEGASGTAPQNCLETTSMSCHSKCALKNPYIFLSIASPPCY